MNDDGTTLVISVGDTRFVIRLVTPRRTKPPMTRKELRAWIARKRRSRFYLIAGGLPPIVTLSEDRIDAKS